MRILRFDLPEEIIESVMNYFLDKKERCIYVGLKPNFSNQDKMFFDWVDDDQYIHLSYKEIVYIEHVDKLNVIHTTNGEIVCEGRIEDIYGSLDSDQFAIVNQSVIVNEAYVCDPKYKLVKIKKNDKNVEITVSGSNQKECSERHGISRKVNKGKKIVK